jgi:hypothetical protein
VIHIVNMTPASLSGESHQDSEPNIAVNPANTSEIVATAFTPAPLGGANAPIYVSTDGGVTWTLQTVVPGNSTTTGTFDITVGFATTGGTLYAGILSPPSAQMMILRTPNFNSATTMTQLVTRASEDQPWVVAGSVVVGGTSQDRVYVGNEDGNQPGGRTATVDVSQDAATAPAPAGFTPFQIEHRSTVTIAQLGRGKDGPPIRTALHSSGVVYCAFQRWASGTFPALGTDICVVRDDNWGSGTSPFGGLTDSGDGVIGQRVATNRFIRFNDTMGQERLGSDLAIAVDPADAQTVYIAWCDRVGGATGTDWTLHVSRSTDKGQSWSGDLRTITNAKNPALAVTQNRAVGLSYQQFTGTTWDTKLEITDNAWSTTPTPLVLHTASSSTPTATFLPYIGDYIRLVAVGNDLYGVFCGNNTPNLANFPNGVTYQRGVDWAGHRLLSTDGHTVVAPSIDPFFFHWSALTIPRGPIINRGPIQRGPITPSPIINRGPIAPRPPQPPAPPEPIDPIGPIETGPPGQSPTNLEL